MPYAEHKIFSDPEQGMKLWRYIDLEKLKSLLERRSLFFCRADRFADPFEGASPEREVADRERGYRELMNSVHGPQISDEDAREHAVQLEWLQAAVRQSVIISCWHANKNESDAMWRLYLKDWHGVAVQTTPVNLKASFQSTAYDVYAGLVRYLDYDNEIYHESDFQIDGYNAMTPFVHKRRFFVHENEYRAVICLPFDKGPAYDWSNEEFDGGKLIDVHLNTLVDRIIVPPQPDDAFLYTVEKMVKEAELSVEVGRSTMSGVPRF